MTLYLTSRPKLGSADPFYWKRPRGMGGAWWRNLRGLGITANPNGSSSTLVNQLASAIATQEGYGAANSACTSINNPGCLRAGPGQTGTSAQGFAVFPDADTGWSALDSQIQSNINLGVNLQQFFAGEPGVYPGYAPSADSNNPSAYANNVASAVGISTTTPLSQIQSTYDGSSPIDLTDLTAAVDASASDDSGDDSTDYTPYIIAGAAALALFAMMR